jgi:hypothetical protein
MMTYHLAVLSMEQVGRATSTLRSVRRYRSVDSRDRQSIIALKLVAVCHHERNCPTPVELRTA